MWNHPDVEPPDGFLHAAGLVMIPEQIRPREGRAWLVDWQGTRGVLRQQASPAHGADVARLTADMTWLHAFLARLAGTGFPSPRPLPCFEGRSWTLAADMLWEITSFLPGHAAGWEAEPSMEEIGTLLARYHATVRRIEVASQRPGALPLADVPSILLSPQIEAVCLDPDQTATIRGQAAQLARDLDEVAHLTGERLVIHGDFTTDNVIANGTPPRATGVIDFALAHAETPLADIGYGLWRSGRPHQDADHLDLRKVFRFLRGYAATIPVSADQAHLIAVYLRGRGLQKIAKRVRAGRAETGMLAEVQWLSANAPAINDALAAAVR
jgi:Ser/Thr protein kinase RdoA (MazF antagonist)